jgi:hypothetical protein
VEGGESVVTVSEDSEDGGLIGTGVVERWPGRRRCRKGVMSSVDCYMARALTRFLYINSAPYINLYGEQVTQLKPNDIGSTHA